MDVKKYKTVGIVTPSITSLVALAGFTILSGLTEAHADFFLHRLENHFQPVSQFRISPEFNYYSTTSNYDSSGNLVNPTYFDKYSRTGGDLTAEFGLHEKFSAFARLTYTRAVVTLTNKASDGVSYGLADQTLGATFRLLSQGPHLDFQVQGDFPAYDNVEAAKQGRPFLGDSTTDLTGSIFATFPLSQSPGGEWQLQGGAGYTYRSDAFSPGVPYSVVFKREAIGEGVVFKLGVAGYYSLGDPYGTKLVTSSVGAGGSFIANSLKPTHVTPYGRVGYLFGGKTTFYIEAAQTLLGSVAPASTQIALGASFSFGASHENEYQKSNKGFVSYELTATVSKSNDKLNLVKIDKGSSDGISVGNVFDLFAPKGEGSNEEPVARAKVTAVKSHEAVLQIMDYYKEVWIDEGFIARRPLD